MRHSRGSYKSAKEKMIPLRELQAQILANAPDGVLKRPLSFMAKKAREARTPSTKPRDETETGFTHDLIAELRRHWHTMRTALYRNNNGAWRDHSGKTITYGLGTGSPDGCGYRSIIVTQEMVGQRLAVFAGLESKTDSDKTDKWNQWFWLKSLHEAGGIALIINAARGLPYAIKQIEDWRPGMLFTLPEPPKEFDDDLDGV